VKDILDWSQPRLTLWFAASAILLAGVFVIQSLGASRTLVISAPAVQVSQARLAPGTEGLLRQTAEHLSKMLEGASIGGFPGFEPPDDEEYRRKIKEQNYSAQDVNDWVKEINNFLGQIAQKNPGLTLREILQRHGLTQSQIENYIAALQRVHYAADGMKGFGVSEKTVETLTSLLKTLGVPTWAY
jgi:hypothetical protein